RAAALTPRHSTYRRSTGHSRRCADGGSQPAAQLRPNKLQRSARKRSHSANTRTVPTPRTATFLTHRLTIASENSRQPRVSGGEKSVTRAAHAAAITTTSARSRNRRLAIVVAPCLHLGGLSNASLNSEVAGQCSRFETDSAHLAGRRAPSYAVPFFGPVFRLSFSSIASVTKCMSTMSCVTQYSLRRRWRLLGMRVANCVWNSSA